MQVTQCLHLKVITHQADIKDLEAAYFSFCVSSHWLRLGDNVALGNNCLYQQLAVLCIHHSKRENRRRPRTADKKL